MSKEIGKFSAIERLERLPLTRYQFRIFAVIALAWFFDCIDLCMMVYLLAPIKDYFHLSTIQTGLLGSVGFGGMFIGAAMAGLLGDKFGRKIILQISILIWGAASFLCASAPDINYLMFFRFLLGIGMAMELPVGQALVCELIPAKHRGRYVAILEGFVPLGAITAGILAYLILPVASWRGLFFIQGLLAICVIILRRYIPESPRWLESIGKTAEANSILTSLENGVSNALRGKPLPRPESILIATAPKPRHGLITIWSSIYAKRTFMLWLTWFLILMGYHGLKTWLGSLLHARGYSIMESTSYIMITSFAGIPGFITAVWLVEKWGRKPTLITTLFGIASSFCLFSTAGNSTQIILYGLMMQFFMFAMWCPLYVYTPELYPTNVRATGTGCASACGRLGSMLGPSLVGIILSNFGQSCVFELGAALLIAAAIVILILGEETKGQLLEKISPQI